MSLTRWTRAAMRSASSESSSRSSSATSRRASRFSRSANSVIGDAPSVDEAEHVGGFGGEVAERAAGVVVVVEDDRFAVVATGTDTRVEGDGTEEREVVVVGELAAAAAPEDVVFAAAVWADESAHVL